MLLCLRVCAALLKDGLGIGLNRQEEAERMATELLITEAEEKEKQAKKKKKQSDKKKKGSR